MEDDGPTNCIPASFPTTLLRSLCHYSELRPGNPEHDPEYSYSKPFVLLEVIWNLGFALVSVLVLLCTLKEKPSTPLRVWVSGYAFQCILHLGFVYCEYQRRIHAGVLMFEGYRHISTVKKLESANTIASSFWWVVGFYCIVTGGQSLPRDSPCLYWLTVVFLALDVFFMIFCIGVACVVFLALFCCIPVVAIAYAMTLREGASEDEIKELPRYTFHQSYAPKTSEIMRRTVVDKLYLQLEDSECCICLSAYNEGTELCMLPCNHHFHYGCLTRWLRINATCPLCKFNIRAKGDTLV